MNLSAWQLPEWETALLIVSTDRFRALPSKFDVHARAIMEEFAYSVASSPVQEELFDALHGKGAFRNFRSTVRREGVERAWFAFQEAALRKIAIDWCEAQGVSWV